MEGIGPSGKDILAVALVIFVAGGIVFKLLSMLFEHLSFGWR